MQAFLGSLGRLARNPFSSFLTVLVIALALALPTALRLLVVNAQAATGGFSSAVNLSVYLKPDVPLVKAQQLERKPTGSTVSMVVPSFVYTESTTRGSAGEIGMH